MKLYVNRYCGAEDYERERMIEDARYYIRPRISLSDPTKEDDFKAAESERLRDYFKSAGSVDQIKDIFESIKSKDLFKFIDKFITEGDAKFLLILADAGMGKTTFVINYFLYNARRVLIWKRQRLKLKYLGFGDVIHKINAIPDSERNLTTIILDGFDEDSEAASDYKRRFEEVLKACVHFRHVIITCRTQFFPSDEDIPALIKSCTTPHPRKLGEPAQIVISIAYLAPFNDKEVKKYIRKRYRFWEHSSRARLYSLTEQIPTLSMRPMVLAYGSELTKHSGAFRFLVQIYSEIINQWLVRESSWVDPEQMKQFSQNLSVQTFSRANLYQGWRMPRKDFEKLLNEYNIPKIERWKVSNRSLLNRDSVGNLKFAHRTFMEFFLIKAYWEGEKSVRDSWSDMMRQFFIEHFYLELEKRSKLLKVALERFAGHKWPPQSDDGELLTLYKNCLSHLGTSFNPHRANSPLILRFDLSEIDLGYYDDYRPQHYENVHEL